MGLARDTFYRYKPAVKVEDVKRFQIADLHVLKFSMPKPTIERSRHDRDMQGAHWARLLQQPEAADYVVS